MRRRSFLATLAVSVPGLSGCLGQFTGDAGSDGTTTTTGPVVEMKGGNFSFDPVGLAVAPGTTVTWLCGRGAPHTATAYPERVPQGVEPFASPQLAQQQTYEFTFEVEGVYDYYCIPHRSLSMVGRVVCGDPGDVDPGQPPDGEVPTVEGILGDEQ